MTLIMLWRDISGKRAWIVSDSRIATQGSGGGMILHTDRAAKILEVKVSAILSADEPTVLESRTLGFAYAGSSLIALQAYSAVISLWSRLILPPGQALPSVVECATHLGKFLEAYGREVAATSGRTGSQCFLIGFNETAKRIEACSIEFVADSDGLRLTVEEITLPEGKAACFGSGAPGMLEKLGENSGWTDQPLEILRHSLKDPYHDTVGGGVQLGLITERGFELSFDVQPSMVGIGRTGGSLVSFRYRGFDLIDIDRVGGALVGLRGIGHF